MAAGVLGYVWNAIAGRFIGPNGQFLSFAAVRAGLDTALDGASADARLIAEAYNAGEIGVAEFENQMRVLIKDTQIYSAAVASGGFNALGAQEIAALEAELTAQFEYLANWADDLASGAARTAIGGRAAMYAQAARTTYDQIFRGGQIDRGYTEERNILNPGESCDLCISITDDDWVDIGTNIPIGLRTCLTNCNCDTEYR